MELVYHKSLASAAAAAGIARKLRINSQHDFRDSWSHDLSTEYRWMHRVPLILSPLKLTVQRGGFALDRYLNIRSRGRGNAAGL